MMSGGGEGTNRTLVRATLGGCSEPIGPAAGHGDAFRTEISAGAVTTHAPHCEEKTGKSSSGALRKMTSSVLTLKPRGTLGRKAGAVAGPQAAPACLPALLPSPSFHREAADSF